MDQTLDQDRIIKINIEGEMKPLPVPLPMCATASSLCTAVSYTE